LEDLSAQHGLLDSLTNAQNALGALEDSIQHPLDDGDLGSFTFPAMLRDTRRPRISHALSTKMVAAAVAVLALLVIFVWLFGGEGSKEEDEGDQAEQITSAPQKILHTSSGEVVVELSRDEQARIGLETEKVNTVTQSEGATAYGVVLDPAPLAALDAALASDAHGLARRIRTSAPPPLRTAKCLAKGL
jgi:hypothetical protein